MATVAGAGIFCGACGKRNPPTSRFCGNCGRPIGAAAASLPRAPAQHGAGMLLGVKPSRRWVWLVGLGAGAYLVVVMAALAVIFAPTETPPCQEPCIAPPPKTPAVVAPKAYPRSPYGSS